MNHLFHLRHKFQFIRLLHFAFDKNDIPIILLTMNQHRLIADYDC